MTILLSVLLNNSSPVASKDGGAEKESREGVAKEGRGKRCRVDELILFCEGKKASATQQSDLMWYGG